MQELERTLPSAIDAEESVIASIIVDPEAVYAVSDILKPEHFFREKNAWCYEAMINVWANHEPIDQITIAAELARAGRIEAVGIAYLTSVIALLGSTMDCEYHAQMVKRTWQQRQLILAGQQIAAMGYDADLSTSLERAQELLRKISVDGHKEGPQTLMQIMTEYLPKLDDYMSSVEATKGLPTGFKGIDSVTEGISGLTILGGRPSNYKTEMALNIIRHTIGQGKSVLLFSADASKFVVAERLLSIEAHTTIQRAKLAEGDNRRILQEQLTEAAELLQTQFGDKLGVDDSPRLSRARIEGRLQRWESEHGKPALIVFDYVELYAQKGEGEERISRVIEDFRDIGKLHNIPVLALSQLNREIEKRDIPRPQLSDLRYSGMLEQAGDVILFVWWPWSYKDRRNWHNEPPPNYLEIVIAKNKEGIANTITGLNVSPSIRRMTDWNGDWPMIG